MENPKEKEKKLTETVKNFLKPKETKNKPFTELTDELEHKIRLDAVDEFIAKFDFLSLFEQAEQKGLMDLLLPYIAPIVSFITLLVVLFK